MVAGRTPHARRTVGVIGGLGPQATAEFFQQVLDATPAGSDQEHIHLIIESDPTLPNRNDAIAGRGPSPGPGLAKVARRLEDAGAELVVMVCNTAHAFQAEIQSALRDTPFLSLIDVTIQAVTRDYPEARSVGILAAAGCLDADLYGAAARRHGLVPVGPTDNERAHFMDLLYRIKAGHRGANEGREMCALAEGLARRGAEVLIAACTEVQLVLPKHEVSLPLVSSTEELVRAVVAIGTGTIALPSR